ncbi:MAG: rhomboid family intramembrane serine protease [Oscillospiraceae bacterium]|nr:rhomboid family intramembrane serine protease [Oscillospiraceae bacterium]
MKIKDIYRRKGNCFVSVMIGALCMAVTLVYMLFPDTYQALAYAYPIRYPWQICSGVFLHGSPELPLAGSIGHLVFNLLLILPFGIMAEKILGSKRFALMSMVLWVVNAITFFVIAMVVTPKGETAYGAGISGVAFSYGIIGLYVLWVLGKKDHKRLFKQVSFYLLINIVVAMIVMVNPYVAGVSSMIIHIVAIVFGIVFAAFYRKEIGAFLQDRQEGVLGRDTVR